MGQRILLIEDDSALGTQVVGHLRAAGFETRWLTQGQSFHEGSDSDFDLLVLDLMLPGVAGLAILRRFRQRPDGPVRVLSARIDNETRVQALQLGPDDYLPKPFWPEE